MTHEDAPVPAFRMITHEELHRVPVVIFDNDGTLHWFETPTGVMKGSLLEQALNAKRLEFIMTMEQKKNGRIIDPEDAQAILQTCYDPVDITGASKGISKRYQVPVEDIKRFQWNLYPDGLIQNFGLQVLAVRELKRQGKILSLVTAAPAVWVNRVIEKIGLTGVFDYVHTWEPGIKKEDIFRQYAERYGAENVVSIGDQIHSDIEPALKHGLHVFWVNNPRALYDIVYSCHETVLSR